MWVPSYTVRREKKKGVYRFLRFVRMNPQFSQLHCQFGVNGYTKAAIKSYTWESWIVFYSDSERTYFFR